METENAQVLFAADVTANYYPLCLYYRSDNRNWTLNFQSKPVKRIIRSGDKPTRDEIMETLAGQPLPVMMITICEIAAEIAEVVP